MWGEEELGEGEGRGFQARGVHVPGLGGRQEGTVLWETWGRFAVAERNEVFANSPTESV